MIQHLVKYIHRKDIKHWTTLFKSLENKTFKHREKADVESAIVESKSEQKAINLQVKDKKSGY